MNFNAEQFTATQQANLNMAAGLSQSAFAGFERLVELNMAAGKAAGRKLGDGQSRTGCPDPRCGDRCGVEPGTTAPAGRSRGSGGRGDER